jgi:response regulator of citrate/malate metabolism
MANQTLKNFCFKGFHKKPIFLKVLSVDDSQTIYKHLNYMFQDLKFVNWIGHAFNIKRAKELILENNPDIILLDIMLNDENGLDLLQELYETERDFNILILSNLNNVIYNEKSKAFGASYFIDKSFEFYKIEDLLLQEFNRRRSA